MKQRFYTGLILVCVLFAQGCASTQVLKLTDEQKSERIVLGARKSVKLMSPTFGSTAVLVTGAMFGALGGAIGGGTAAAMEVEEGRKLTAEYNLPDFNQLVLESLASRIKTELPEYTNVTVINTPLTDEASKVSDFIVMSVQVQLLSLANKAGLTTVTALDIRGHNKEKLGLRKFTYNTKKMNRPIKMEELKEANGALIKEEIHSAAEKTVDEFIQYLKADK